MYTIYLNNKPLIIVHFTQYLFSYLYTFPFFRQCNEQATKQPTHTVDVSMTGDGNAKLKERQTVSVATPLSPHIPQRGNKH